MADLATALAVAALMAPVSISDEHGEMARVSRGSAEGPFATLWLFNGDIVNVRNIQGGTVLDPNLDIAAGSDGTTGPRGNISLNYDVGRSVKIYDGHTNLIARFGPGRTITFYVKPRVVPAAR